MKNRYAGIDEFITNVIKGEVKKLVGRYGIRPHDTDDIEQELHTQIWKRLNGLIGPDHPQYKAAVRKTVDRRIKDLIEHRNAQKRQTERDALMIDEDVVAPDTEELEPVINTLDLELCQEVFGGAAPVWHRRRHVKMDLEAALAALPAELRRLSDAIDQLNGNLSAVGRELGLSRNQVHADLEELKKHLLDQKNACFPNKTKSFPAFEG